MDNAQGDMSTILYDILSYSDDIFCNFVKEFVGVIEGTILETQRIKKVRILLQIPGIFLFLQLNFEETFGLKQSACFIADDFLVIVRPVIKANIERLIVFLRHYKSKFINR